MEAVSDLLTNRTYRVKETNPIGTNRTYRNNKGNLVDRMLLDNEDLIDGRYKNWFAKQFYVLDESIVTIIAHQCRAEADDKYKLFAFKIKRAIKS